MAAGYPTQEITQRGNVVNPEFYFYRQAKPDGGFDFYRDFRGDTRSTGVDDIAQQTGWSVNELLAGGGYDSGAPDPGYDPAQVANIRSGLGNIRSTAASTGSSARRRGMTDIREFATGLGNQQEDIDEQAVQNELAKQQATQGIMGMVGRGIRSGNVMLANRNAGDSSAAGALARAYGDVGNREGVRVGQQYAIGQRGVEKAQGRFDEARDLGVRKFRDEVDASIQGIVTSAAQALAELDSRRAGLSLPEQFDIADQKARIKARAQAQLEGLRDLVGQEAGGIQAKTPEQRRAEAAGLLSSGSGAENPFLFTQQAPSQFQGTGPAPGGLPLYTRPRTDEEV